MLQDSTSEVIYMARNGHEPEPCAFEVNLGWRYSNLNAYLFYKCDTKGNSHAQHK